MKLLYCKDCQDMFLMDMDEQSCSCGESSGHYIDSLNCVYTGNAVCVGLDNNSFKFALENQMIDGPGVRIDACIIPLYSDATIKVSDNIDCKIFNEYSASFVEADWKRKIKFKRESLFAFIYKICKKLMEVNIKSEDKYESISESIAKIYNKVSYYLDDDFRWKDIYYVIEMVGIKDQNKIKEISRYNMPGKMLKKLTEVYESYYGKIEKESEED